MGFMDDNPFGLDVSDNSDWHKDNFYDYEDAEEYITINAPIEKAPKKRPTISKA